MILTLKDITKSYTNSTGKVTREVLKNLNLSIGEGEMVAVTGPSGSGKTTLLNLAGALDTPDSGEIIFKNFPLGGKTEPELAQFRNHEIGFVFQMHHLMPQLTAIENILLPTLACKSNDKATEYAPELMEKLGIRDISKRKHAEKAMRESEISNQKPGELSGGECQRVAVARALINKPSLILADEPTGSLDEQNAFELVSLLKNVNKMFGTAIIMVTHANALAQDMEEVYSLKNGTLTAH